MARPTDAGHGPQGGVPLVGVRQLRTSYARANRQVVTAVDGVSLDVFPGEFLVLLGPSGCGKTTLLRSIAGLETPQAGSVRIAGRTVFDAVERVDVPPERRGISMMFQSYALWPHMTVFANVAYPLENRRARPAKQVIAEEVHTALDLVGIAELARQHPGEISGGQQQRVALARALAAGDELVLFDEPLSNVDAKVRERLRIELLAMQRRLGFAAVYVTHDQAEAMELATRIAVMRDGRIEQLGPPRDIYEAPSSRYVANFVGVANEVPGTVVGLDRDRAVLETVYGRLVGIPGHPALAEGDEAVAVWRPEHGRLTAAEPGAPVNRWSARCLLTTFAGPHTEHHLGARGLTCRVWASEAVEPAADGAMWVGVPHERTRVLPAGGRPVAG